MEFAAVGAFNKKLEFTEIKNIFVGKNSKKVRFQPVNETDFKYDKNYVELCNGCENDCETKHKHNKKYYRPIRIRFLGSKYLQIFPLKTLIFIVVFSISCSHAGGCGGKNKRL